MSEADRISKNSIRTIVSDFHLDNNHAVDIRKFLDTNNIRFRECDLGQDKNNQPIIGACKSQGLKKLIVINSAVIMYEPRRRFTIAHEIGHLYLHQQNFCCTATDFELWRDKRNKEVEANQFAADFLLPQDVIESELNKGDLSFKSIDEISNRYLVSLTATALRLLKESKDNVIIVLHDGKKVEWAAKSNDCSMELSSIVITPDGVFEKLGTAKNTLKKEVSVSTWFSEVSGYWKCWEESRYFSESKKCFTILNLYEE